MRRSILPVLGLAVLTACADDPTSPTPSGPVQLSMSAVTGSSVACGAQVEVTVTVSNDRGRPVNGFLVNFNVLEGGGSMFAGAALSNSKGVAKDLWTMGRVPNAMNTVAIRSVDPVTGVGTTHATQTVRTLSRIAFARVAENGHSIYTIGADGTGELLLAGGPEQSNREPAWSPDGSKIAFTRDGGGIFVMNADGSGQVPLTAGSAPSWSPDGRKIVVGQGLGLYVVNRDGTGATLLAASMSGDYDPAWSPDGRSIAFASLSRTGGHGIFVMNADGTGQAMRLTDVGMYVNDWHPAWSPDSRKLVFHRDYNGDDADIFVVNADGTNETRLTPSSTGYNMYPTWSPDGSQIVFSSYANQGLFIMNADGSEITRLTGPHHELEASWAGVCQ